MNLENSKIPPTRNELIEQRALTLGQAYADDKNKNEIFRKYESQTSLHPFFGYLPKPNPPRVNNFGFACGRDFVVTDKGYAIEGIDREKHFVVGLFGGSFALQMGQGNAKWIEAALRPAVAPKEPLVLNLAAAGHALPQSFFIFAHFSSLLDAVVFLDGANELWNAVHNNACGCPPEYAKAYHYLYKIARAEMNPALFSLTAKLLQYQRRAEFITKISLLPVIRSSRLVHNLWQLAHGSALKKAAKCHLSIVGHYQDRPPFTQLSDDQLIDLAVERWFYWHTLIGDICRERSLLDLHLVQPSPFVEGSKVLSHTEQKMISRDVAGPTLASGYPKLLNAARNLAEKEIRCSALTDVFFGKNEDLWKDCFHANFFGYKLTAQRVGELLREALPVSRLGPKVRAECVFNRWCKIPSTWPSSTVPLVLHPNPPHEENVQVTFLDVAKGAAKLLQLTAWVNEKNTEGVVLKIFVQGATGEVWQARDFRLCAGLQTVQTELPATSSMNISFVATTVQGAKDNVACCIELSRPTFRD